MPASTDTACGREEATTYKSAKTHSGNVSVTLDLDLWHFDPEVNGFLGLFVEHFCVEFGDRGCISFWVMRKSRHTDKQKWKLHPLLLLSAWVTGICGATLRLSKTYFLCWHVLASAVQRVRDIMFVYIFRDVCIVELVIKQLKLNDDSSSAESADEIGEIFRELEEHLPKVKDMALSAKRSAAVAADCTNNVVLCSSRF